MLPCQAAGYSAVWVMAYCHGPFRISQPVSYTHLAAGLPVGEPAHIALVLQLLDAFGQLGHLHAHLGGKISQIEFLVRVRCV